jgi:hypothetical protein
LRDTFHMLDEQKIPRGVYLPLQCSMLNISNRSSPHSVFGPMARAQITMPEVDRMTMVCFSFVLARVHINVHFQLKAAIHI